jgi:hypothetical protein
MSIDEKTFAQQLERLVELQELRTAVGLFKLGLPKDKIAKKLHVAKSKVVDLLRDIDLDSNGAMK